jgi:hypothetical protein
MLAHAPPSWGSRCAASNLPRITMLLVIACPSRHAGHPGEPVPFVTSLLRQRRSETRSLYDLGDLPGWPGSHARWPAMT